MLRLSEESKDLGTLKEGEIRAFAVKVYNDGSEPIKIEKLSVGCPGCTAAGLMGDPVLPTEPSILNVSFEGKSKGLNIKTVRLEYGEKKILKLTFRAQVE